MVSFHTPLKTIKELENSKKKRKWKEEEEAVEELPLLGSRESKSPRCMFDAEPLHLETPLPLEWQRCLDIKSGEIHYYNMRTQTRTSNDPRTINVMSLDLELNLPCGSATTTTTKTLYSSSPHGNSDTSPNWSKDKDKDKDKGKDYSAGGKGFPRCPSWLAFGGDDDEREMITAVCKKCHMLVMMCKSSPACPNCKFVHPPDQTLPSNLFSNKSGLSLLC